MSSKKRLKTVLNDTRAGIIWHHRVEQMQFMLHYKLSIEWCLMSLLIAVKVALSSVHKNLIALPFFWLWYTFKQFKNTWAILNVVCGQFLCLFNPFLNSKWRHFYSLALCQALPIRQSIYFISWTKFYFQALYQRLNVAPSCRGWLWFAQQGHRGHFYSHSR